MPALKPTGHIAEISWIGRVADRAAGLVSEAMQAARLDWGGIEGEAHGGVNRPACSRVGTLHPRNTEIRNTRQLSIVSAEELAEIAAASGLDAIDPAWLGASLVVQGIGDFTHVPPGSRLQGPDGATLVVDMENRPCVYPGRVIEAARPGHGKAFKTAAQNRRGVTAWVERPGRIALGDRLRLHIPDQPAWAHLDAARGA